MTDISRSTVMHPSRDNDTGHLVFNMYEMFDSQSIYWLAPDLYISNKLQSYGSILIFSISRVSLFFWYLRFSSSITIVNEFSRLC